MAEDLYDPIVPDTTTGANAATNLNKASASTEIAIKWISEFAEIANEVGFYRDGTIVFCEAEGLYYQYVDSTGLWTEYTEIPTFDTVYDTTTADGRYAPIAKGVTNGDTHDHNGGDGAQIDHVNLANKGTNTHAQIDSHIANTSNPHSTTAAQAGAPALVSPSVTGNLVSFAGTAGTQADSGHKPADFLHADGSVTADFINFKYNASAPTYAEGNVYWDSTDKTLALQTEKSVTTIQLGQEQVVRCLNVTGSQIDDGKVVYISGAQGNRPKIALADADTEATSYVLGMTTSDIPTGEEGYVTTLGIVRGINTASYDAGDLLYLSSVAGELTKTAPTAPKHKTIVGIALNSVGSGSVFVSPLINRELSELDDVLITDIADNDFIAWDAANGRWKNTKVASFTTSTFGNVSGGNYSEFEADGTYVAHGDATTFDDIGPMATSVGSGVNAPSFTNYYGSQYAYEFVGTSNTKNIYMAFQMPHRYKAGSNVSPHLHLYIPTVSAPAAVKFTMTYTWTNIGAAETSETSLSTVINLDVADSNTHKLFEFTPDITGTGKTFSSIIQCVFTRNPGDSQDTFTSSVWLKSADVHVEMDKLGSRQEYVA